MCSGSSKSLNSALVGLYVASAFVLALRSLISSGVTGSSPYSNLKGVNFVALQTEVLWLHTALSNSSTYLPFGWSSNIFFMAVNISAFAFSTTPLDWGWYADVKAASTSIWWQKSLNIWQSNCLALSTAILLGTLKQYIMFCQKNLLSPAATMLTKGSPLSICWSILLPLLHTCNFAVHLSVAPLCWCSISAMATTVWWVAMVETVLGCLAKTSDMPDKLWQASTHHRLWKANRNPAWTLSPARALAPIWPPHTPECVCDSSFLHSSLLRQRRSGSVTNVLYRSSPMIWYAFTLCCILINSAPLSGS
jgi:hypothetical protein